MHAPVAVLQLSVVQVLPSSQFFAAPGLQTPARQVSPMVQALPSLQVVPSGAVGLLHTPDAGSQVPAVWH
jgi:hypothetical protein